MKQLNERLTEIKLKMKEKERLTNILERAKEQKQQIEIKKNNLLKELEKEKLDVEKLKGLSLNNLIYMILGDKEERLEKEKKEVIAAKLKYDNSCEQLENINKEIDLLQEKLSEFGDLENQYETIIKKKEEIILKSSIYADELNNLIELEVELNSKIKELKEAFEVGKELLSQLLEARTNLESAGNWGLWDTFGGGMISTMIKHSKIDHARESIDRIQITLNRFHRELQDIGEIANLNIQIGSFLTFADYFIDGLFIDLTVQSKIRDAQSRVDDTIEKVERIVSQLKKDITNSEDEYKRIKDKKLSIIESV